MPNWLGDAVMATPALANLKKHRPTARYTLVGSAPVAQLFGDDPGWHRVVVDDCKQQRWRLQGMWRLTQELGRFDVAITLRNSLSCTLFLKLTRASRRVGATAPLRRLLLNHVVSVDRSRHQVEIYNQIVNGYLGQNSPPGPTWLYVAVPAVYPRPTLGIAPGATYGDAKRWPASKFAEVAVALAARYQILLLGSPQEAAITAEIATILQRRGGIDYYDLAGKTTIRELVATIAGLSLFITNDSGPMHIAGAFNIPTVAIFGPTIAGQTSPWQHGGCQIVNKQLPCAPCMQRSCPYGHHNCMEQISAAEVVAAAANLPGVVL